MLTMEVEKINRKMVAQTRILMITTHFFYNIKPKAMFSRIKIRNRFPISALTTIIYSKTSFEVVLSFPMLFDFHLKTSDKDTILQYLFQAKSTI